MSLSKIISRIPITRMAVSSREMELLVSTCSIRVLGYPISWLMKNAPYRVKIAKDTMMKGLKSTPGFLVYMLKFYHRKLFIFFSLISLNELRKIVSMFLAVFFKSLLVASRSSFS